MKRKKKRNPNCAMYESADRLWFHQRLRIARLCPEIRANLESWRPEALDHVVPGEGLQVKRSNIGLDRLYEDNILVGSGPHLLLFCEPVEVRLSPTIGRPIMMARWWGRWLPLEYWAGPIGDDFTLWNWNPAPLSELGEDWHLCWY